MSWLTSESEKAPAAIGQKASRDLPQQMGSGRDLGSRARSAQPLSQVTRLKSPRTVLRFRSLPLDLVTARHRHPLPNLLSSCNAL